jgi:hypothetical protein
MLTCLDNRGQRAPLNVLRDEAEHRAFPGCLGAQLGNHPGLQRNGAEPAAVGVPGGHRREHLPLVPGSVDPVVVPGHPGDQGGL